MTTIDDIAARHGFSGDAGRAAYAALQAGGFSQAQFSHPELGGMGQWMSGGMMMIGDMFNDNLKWRVGALLTELSQHREPQAAMARPQARAAAKVQERKALRMIILRPKIEGPPRGRTSQEPRRVAMLRAIANGRGI